VRLHRADMVVAWVGGAQRVDGLQAPMAGRDGELRRVKELFHATQADGRARLVVVSGIAGIGKSRLGWEFDKYADGIGDELFWHRGRCLSYGDGVAFWAFAEMIRSRLRIVEGDERVVVETKVREGVAAVAATDEEAAWLVPRLGALVSGGGTASFDRTDLFAAWTTFLERVAGDQPVALLFEDTQHADDGLLDLIEHLLRTTRARLFVLAFARPELLDRRPGLTSVRGAALVELGPLPDAAMAALVDGLVADLPGRTRTALVGRAEGVPLYAVELVRSLIDQDAVVAREGRYVFVDHDHAAVDLAGLATPTSLQTLIAARLDALSPLERRTVQDAAVLGMSFRYGGLRALTDASSYDLDAALASLVDKGVLEPQGDPGPSGPGQYRFVQAMVREVAYGTLARADRRTRHLAAAEHLEQADAESRDAQSGIIAQHLLDALAASRPDDPARADLTARARPLLVAAAARAESLGSPAEALRSTLTALDLDPQGTELLHLRERAARAARLAGQLNLAMELATQAVNGFREQALQADLPRALGLQARIALGLGRSREAGELATSAHAMLVEQAQPSLALACDLLRSMGASARASGDQAAWQRFALQALSLAEELQDPGVLHRALTNLSLMLLDAGSRSGHLSITERCLVMAREAHLLEALGDSLTNLAAERYADKLEAATEHAEESVTVARQVGDSAAIEVALTNACFIWWLNGDWNRVLAETGAWFEDREVSASSGSLWISRAQVQQARGEAVDVPDIPASEDLYDQQTAALALALRVVSQDGAAAAATTLLRQQSTLDATVTEDFEVIWAPGVELQLAAGDVEAARTLLALAAPLAGGRGRALTHALMPRMRGLLAAASGEDPEADLRDAEARLAVYGAPYLLARTRLDLGRWLLGQDRGDEAEPLLGQARSTFAHLAAAPSLAEVDALVAPPRVGPCAHHPSAPGGPGR
jgi:predicted ATPase